MFLYSHERIRELFRLMQLVFPETTLLNLTELPKLLVHTEILHNIFIIN
jgi:hypothetical protein